MFSLFNCSFDNNIFSGFFAIYFNFFTSHSMSFVCDSISFFFDSLKQIVTQKKDNKNTHILYRVCSGVYTHEPNFTLWTINYCYVRRGRRTSHTDSCESVWACNSFNLNLVFWWCVYACITHMHSHLSLFIYLFLFSSICFVFSIL